METETYKKAKQILERFDPEKFKELQVASVIKLSINIILCIHLKHHLFYILWLFDLIPIYCLFNHIQAYGKPDILFSDTCTIHSKSSFTRVRYIILDHLS